MISTHVLDIGAGRPASGVGVALEMRSAGGWIAVGAGTTDDRGRVASLSEDVKAGEYRLTFQTGDYYRAHGATAFFPEVQVIFRVADDRAHVHVPLVISPFGYSTYRGA